MTASLFEQAEAKLAAGEAIDEWLFRFDLDFDGMAFGYLIATIRALLQREDLSPQQLSTLSKFLLGLRRLPLVTPGLAVRLELIDEAKDECRVWEVWLHEDWFGAAWSGWVRGPLGIDSISGDPCELRPGRQYYSCLWEQEWMAELPNIASWAKLRVEDDSRDAELDWDHDDGSTFWSALEQ